VPSKTRYPIYLSICPTVARFHALPFSGDYLHVVTGQIV
jgi:hypothetical protein